MSARQNKQDNSIMKHIFIGFGPIQSGFFINEAFQNGNFDRIAALLDKAQKNKLSKDLCLDT